MRRPGPTARGAPRASSSSTAWERTRSGAFPPSGGTVVDLIKAADVKSAQVGWPAFLPDGKHFLFLAIAPKVSESMYRIGSLDAKETQPFAPAQSQITYVEPGYLLFLRDRTLVAQPFDAKTLKTTGEPIPLAEQVGTDSVGLARFSVSREGTLAYRTGEMTDRLVWVDRSGKELETEGDPSRYARPAALSGWTTSRFRRHGLSHREGRHLDPGSRPQGELPLQLLSGGRHRGDVLPRRQPDRLFRRQRPGRENRRRPGSRDDAREIRPSHVRDRLVGGRAIHRLLVSGQGHRLRHLDHARVGRPDASSLAADAVLRVERRLFPGRPLPRVPVKRVRAPGDLRPVLPGSRAASGRFPRTAGASRTGAATARSFSFGRPIRRSWRST